MCSKPVKVTVYDFVHTPSLPLVMGSLRYGFRQCIYDKDGLKLLSASGAHTLKTVCSFAVYSSKVIRHSSIFINIFKHKNIHPNFSVYGYYITLNKVFVKALRYIKNIIFLNFDYSLDLFNN